MQISSITNNFTSTVANQHKTGVEQALSKITATRELSGKDGANLINADMLNLQINSMTQQVQNENATISMLQIADGALKGIQDGANRLNELQIASNSAALNNSQRAMLTEEFSSTRHAMNNIMEQATYNGKSLFGSDSAIGLGQLNINESSIESKESMDVLTNQIESMFSDVGSASQKAEVGINNLLAGISSATSSFSGVSETPMSQNINQLSQSSTGVTASVIAQSHNTAILQQQMAALLNF